MKHLKIDTYLARKMRKLQTRLAEEDNSVIYSNAFDEIERIIDELTPAMPKNLYNANSKLKSIKLTQAMPDRLHKQAGVMRHRIQDVKNCVENGYAELAAKMAVGIGIEFTLFCAELAKLRGEGRPENPIWEYVRKIAAESSPNTKKESICADAIGKFKKDHPRGRKLKRDYLVKHYAEKIKTTRPKTCHV